MIWLRIDSPRIAFLVLATVISVLASDRPVPASTPPDAAIFSRAEEAKKLIVRILGDDVEGAGIIVGFDEEFLYGVTARHVVQQRNRLIPNLTGRLRSWSRPLTLEVIKGDRQRDLAAFRIAYRELGVNSQDLDNSLPMSNRGDSRQLNAESSFFTIGHGAGGSWIDSRDPVRLASHDVAGSRDPEMLRLTHYCPTGHSGGGVFDEQWRLVGMMTDFEEPFCHALRIETVLATLADWNLNYRLDKAADLAPTSAEARQAIVVAVAGFDNRSAMKMPHIGRAGRDIITSFLFNLPGIRLVTRDRLDSVLREINLQPTAGTAAGVSRLGQLLDVDALITGSVNRYDVERRQFRGYGTSAAVDSYYMSITLQIIDVDTGLVKFSKTYDEETKKTYSHGSSAPRYPLQLESQLLNTLLTEQAEADVQLALRQVSSGAGTPIAVPIRTHPEGAEVIVGDVYEGRSPTTLYLSIGLHEIEIRKAGYQVWRRQVRVVPDMQPLEVRLVR